MSIILASSSPRRRDLLNFARIEHRAHPSNVDERSPVSGETPTEYSLVLAEQKAESVAANFPAEAVLASDTVVAIETSILGKPVDADDAFRVLKLLRGRFHTVVTAVVVRRGDRMLRSAVAASVGMREASDVELREYVSTGEPMDKAGAYALQGIGGRLVTDVRGCPLAVVGLPLCQTVSLLERLGEPIANRRWCRACDRALADFEHSYAFGPHPVHEI